MLRADDTTVRGMQTSEMNTHLMTASEDAIRCTQVTPIQAELTIAGILAVSHRQARGLLDWPHEPHVSGVC